MICTLSARRLKPGTFEQFKQAFDPGQESEIAKRWNPVYVCRDVSDEDVVLTFGMFRGTLDELRQAQEDYGYEDQVAGISEFVDEVLLDGAYEVIDEIKPD